MKRRSLLLALLSCSLCWAAQTHAGGEQLVVIASKDAPTAKLSREELRPIFQVTKPRWSNGEPIVPFNLPEDNPLRRAFDTAVLGLSPNQVARYWIDKKIRGDVRPPKKLASSAAVARAVAKTPGSIGYVDQQDVTAAVKVVAKIQNGKVIAP
jgi:ABC-type phosphate transport system substrate-binding protein